MEARGGAAGGGGRRREEEVGGGGGGGGCDREKMQERDEKRGEEETSLTLSDSLFPPSASFSSFFSMARRTRGCAPPSVMSRMRVE